MAQVAVEAGVHPYQEENRRTAGGHLEDIWTFSPIKRSAGGDGMDSLSADIHQILEV